MQDGSTRESVRWLRRIAARGMRCWWIAAIAIATITATAHAQSADAEALFRKGQALMKQGAVAAACDKFEASEHLQPRIGAELNLAKCWAKIGRLASAWAMYIQAAQTAKHIGSRDREVEANTRAKELESQLVYLTISVSPSARVAGLEVHRNDTPIAPGAFGQAVPVDPDTYTITAEAPGYDTWSSQVEVSKTNKTIEVPPLHESPKPPPPPAVAAAAPPPPPPPKPSVWTPRRKTAALIGAAGVAVGVTGILFGLHANSLENQSDAICKTTRCSDPVAIDDNSKARTNGLIANIGMIGGGAMAATAVVLWILGARQPSDHDDVSIVPRISPSGIAVEGRF